MVLVKRGVFVLVLVVFLMLIVGSVAALDEYRIIRISANFDQNV